MNKEITVRALESMAPVEARKLTETEWMKNNLSLNSGVTERSASGHAPIWRAKSIIAGLVSSMPLDMYRPEGEGREKVTGRANAKIMKQANEYMTGATFREVMQWHALNGNAYANIEWDKGGNAIALWPLIPQKTEPVVNEKSGRLWYKTTIKQNGTEKTRYLRAEDVLHIKGPSNDGVTGYDVLDLHTKSINLGISARDYGESYFQNGAVPGGVLTHPQRMSQKVYDRLKEDWNKKHEGLNNAHRVAILEEGTSYEAISSNLEDSQLVEAYKMSVEEVSRIYGVPAHMLSESTNATYSNVEHQNMEFYQTTMLFWTTRWEQECTQKLLTGRQSMAEVYYEFNTNVLLRADTAARTSSYQSGINTGWITVNEVRKRENLPPVEGGDARRVPLNSAEITPSGEVKIYTSDDGSEKKPTNSTGADVDEPGNQYTQNMEGAMTDMIERYVDGIASRWGVRSGKKSPDAWLDKLEGDGEAMRTAIGPCLDGIAQMYNGGDLTRKQEEIVGEITSQHITLMLDEWRDALKSGNIPDGKIDSKQLIEDIKEEFDTDVD